MTERPTSSASSPHDAQRGELARVKTGAAAVSALVVGLIALLAALTGLLAPIAIVLGLIGLVLGIVGIRNARDPHTTGKNVAIAGLVLGVLAALLGIATLLGVATVLSSNPQVLDQLQNLINNARR